MAIVAARAITLLLIENSQADADSLGSMFESAAPSGFEVDTVTTLAEATSYLETRSPDCVVVDLGLSDAEGLEVVKSLAGTSPASALVVLTGREDDELGVATIETGASDYLSKSALEGKLLVRSVRFAMLRKRFERSLAEAQGIAHVGSWELDLATSAMTWSRELYRLFDIETHEKPTYWALLERLHPSDRVTSVRAIGATIRDHRPYVVEHRVVLPHGTVRWLRARGRIELDASGHPERLLGTAQDITEQKESDDALLHQALHDPLTGLPNRLLLLDRLSQSLARLARQPGAVAVIYLDVDRFQVINDSLGHAVGDQLLAAIAGRLQGLVPPGDTLARAGGDEFVIVCGGLSGDEAALVMADNVSAAVSEPLPWDGGDLVLSVSAGVALATSPWVDTDSLLKDAEGAMYQAKEDGRARSSLFAETMRGEAVARLDTEIDLRQAILDGDLRVHYQPIVLLTNGEIVGHEALVRWAHPTRGLLGPDQFIAVAEETGLIVPIGEFVLGEACRQAKRFQTRDVAWSSLTMSVNLSGGQLDQPDLLGLVESTLDDTGLAPKHLQLEMTESVLMDNASRTIALLNALSGAGVRLGIDDFGTGYSCLAYLRRFPVDVLKVDRSFVEGVGKDQADSAVVTAIVSLAAALGMTTVAEGVETPLQRDCLISLGCTRAQGYLFARPVPAPLAEAALDRVLGTS